MTAGIAYLDGRRLARGLLAGIERIVADQERLNRINVFPVPDGDTGTNLALTMSSVQLALTGPVDRHAGRTLERVADAALDGARGNSGAILAQFFLGLGDACRDRATLTIPHFVDAVHDACGYAREALSNPREGTILTVMAAFSTELHRGRDRGPDFAPLLEHALLRARQALAATTEQLEELRRARVVDAGAQGFVDLLDGVTEFVRRGAVSGVDAPAGVPDAEEAFPEIAARHTGHQRYCTECIVTGEHVDRRALREALSELGSSLVVAGTHRKARVHVHVDEPTRVFDLAARFGVLSGQKADDMHQQSGAARDRGRKVAVVVDSAGDLPDEEFERLGIHMVPVRIHFGDRSYLDKVSLSSDDFYDELAHNPNHPTTSQPAPGDFRRLYQFLASHHSGVVSIHITGRASGTFQAAEAAAARIDGGTPVVAIDSRNASLGEGLIALEAAELAKAGGDVDAVAARAADSIARTRTWGLLGDVGYAVRGGRVPGYRKVIASLLRLNPVIRTLPDGRIASGGVLFGRRRLVRRFARLVAGHAVAGRQYRIAVAHASDRRSAERLLAVLLELVPDVQAHYLTELGSALGVHGGPGTLVASLQEVGPGGESDQGPGTVDSARLSHRETVRPHSDNP